MSHTLEDKLRWALCRNPARTPRTLLQPRYANTRVGAGLALTRSRLDGHLAAGGCHNDIQAAALFMMPDLPSIHLRPASARITKMTGEPTLTDSYNFSVNDIPNNHTFPCQIDLMPIILPSSRAYMCQSPSKLDKL